MISEITQYWKSFFLSTLLLSITMYNFQRKNFKFYVANYNCKSSNYYNSAMKFTAIARSLWTILTLTVT